VVGAVLVAAMVAAVVGLTVLPNFLSGPERTIQDFFDALVERDTAAALALTTASAAERAEPDLAPLDAGGYIPPGGLSIGAVEGIDTGPDAVETVQADIDYLVGDRPVTDRIRLTRVEGVDPFRGWRLTTWSGRISVSTQDPLVPLVNGADTTSAEGSWQIDALPGSYPVTALDNPVLTGEPATAEVGFDEEVPVTLNRVLRPDVRRSVQAQVTDYLDTCAASTAARPADCPFAADSTVIVAPDSLTWRMISYPELKLTVNRTFDAIRVTTTTKGLVRADEPEGVYTDEEPVTVTGTATVIGGKLRFEPELVG